MRSYPTTAAGLSVLLTLMAVAALATTSDSSVSITVTYDPALDAVVNGLYFGENVVLSSLDLINAPPAASAAANASSAAAAGVNFHISPFVTPAQLTSDTFRTLPLAVASLCIGNTLTSTTAYTVAQIGTLLTGSSSVRKWFIAPPATSPSSALLLRTLVLNAVSGFTNATAWPSTVLKNPSVVLLANDTAISAALYNCSLAVGSTVACLGPQLSIAPWSAPVQCLRVRRTVNITSDSISYSSRLTAAAAPYLIVTPADGTVYGQGNVYPFLGGLLLSIRRTLPCDVAQTITQTLINFFTNSTNTAALDSMGLLPVSDSENYLSINLLTTNLTTDCTSPLLATKLRGDGSLDDVVAGLSFDRFNADGNLLGFERATTSNALTTVYRSRSTALAALVEGAPNTTLRATRPSVVYAPVFAHGLAIVYTLEGREGLTVSLCTLLGILNGTITFWDDPAIKADNVGVQMPRLKITRIINYDASQEAAGRGVSYVARRCGVTLAASYTKYPFASDYGYVASHDVASRVQVVQGSIGLAPTSSAIAANMQQLSILFDSQLQVSGTPGDVASVIARTTFTTVAVNATNTTGSITSSSVFRFPARTIDYFPFVAVVYAIFDTDATGGCPEYREQIEWLLNAISASGAAVLTATNQVQLPNSMIASAQQQLLSVKCDGVAFYPVAPEEVVWWPYAAIVGGCLLFVIAISARLAYRRWLLSVRPTDPTKAVAVMFVGIKNQAAVLEAGEENAAAVHQRMSETVRRVARKHRCYEARRIDAVTTMIVGKSAQATVACAEEIVLALSVDEQWLEQVMTHPMPTQGQKAKQLETQRSNKSSHTSATAQSLPSAAVAKTVSARELVAARSPRTPKQPTSARAQPTSARGQSPSPPSTPLSKRGSNMVMRRMPSQLESPHRPPSKKASSTERSHQTGTQQTSASGLTLQQCVPEVYAGIHWTHVMIDVDDTQDTVAYMGAGIGAAAAVADLAVGGQVTVSRAMVDVLHTECGAEEDDELGEYTFTVVGEGRSSDELAVMSLTTARFPEWLIARAALRRKSLEEKDQDGTATNMIAAAMASADGSLARRRIAVVSLLLSDLLREGSDGRAAVAAEALQDLHDIVTANRGQIHSITDGVVTVTVGAGAPVAMAPVRAAQIAMEAADLCIAAGVHCGPAMVGNAAGGRAVTVGRIVAGAALMRLVAARANVAVVVSDTAQADLTTKFEMATVDLVAAPLDLTKHVRCYAVVEERVQAEEGEWLYDLSDGFAVLERRFDWALKGCAEGATSGAEASASLPDSTAPSTAFLERMSHYERLSNELYSDLRTSSAADPRYLHGFFAARTGSLGSFALTSGRTLVL